LIAVGRAPDEGRQDLIASLPAGRRFGRRHVPEGIRRCHDQRQARPGGEQSSPHAPPTSGVRATDGGTKNWRPGLDRGAVGRVLVDPAQRVLAVKRSGNCFTMASARGSAIICMCAAAVRTAVNALLWSWAAWASTTVFRVTTWCFTRSATTALGRFGLADCRKAPKSCV